MADYWKSQAKKFCDFCKCWIADNKPSRDYHENGKRHKENVEKKIADIRKKSTLDYKMQMKTDNQLAKMEQAASVAYQQDQVNNPDITAQMNLLAKRKMVISQPSLPQEPEEIPIHKDKKSKWCESKMEDGKTIFKNKRTGESSFDTPRRGYTTLREQEEAEERKKLCTFGPQLKPTGYGGWQPVEEEEKVIDLQLPKSTAVPMYVPTLTEEPKFKFKEKTIGNISSIAATSQTTFKKRNVPQKRSIRQRDDDD